MRNHSNSCSMNETFAQDIKRGGMLLLLEILFSSQFQNVFLPYGICINFVHIYYHGHGYDLTLNLL